MTIITTDKPLRARDPFDFYPTPVEVCEAALALVPFVPRSVLDPGAGAGPWGRAAHTRWPTAWIDGYELREVSHPYGYTAWHCGNDFLDATVGGGYALVMGNPPYKLAEAFVRKGLAALRPGGWLVFLLRLAFLEGQERDEGLWAEFPARRVDVLAKRPSFTADRKTDATAYAMFCWERGYCGVPTLHRLRWQYAQEAASAGC